MPTPLEMLLDPLSLAVLAMFALLLLWELVRPGRALPPERRWKLRATISFVSYFFLSGYLPLLWDEWLARWQLVDLTGLGTLGGALAALWIYELAAYWWHRAMHVFAPLWRTVHQMHHSAERLETLGAFYFSPLDMLGWSLLGSLALVLVVGVTAQAATLVLLSITFLAFFQHANIRTPRWLGYLVQRPESHAVHHGRGLHRYNYADLPVFDMLFGTFRNPAGYSCETGFYAGASARIWDMLAFRDVSRPRATTTADAA